MADQKKIKNNKQLKKYLDKFDEVEGNWDGGNDSGSWRIRGDGEELTDSYSDAYLDTLIDKTLNYGSWAGNFSSNGSITYDKTTGMLTLLGDEYDSENKEHIKTVDITLPIPNEVLNTIDEIRIETSDDDNSSVDFHVTTGALLPIHREHEEKLEEIILKETFDICNTDECEDYYYSQTFKAKEIKNNKLVIHVDIEKERHRDINIQINLNEN